MLRSVNHLQGFSIRALDGEIGSVEQVFFDDHTWTIRYLVVNAGSWLLGRLVLISPLAIVKTMWETKELEASLTKAQVEGSPDIDTKKPVSRQHESDLHGYYGYPLYWSGPYFLGGMPYPPVVNAQLTSGAEVTPPQQEKTPEDAHLRSTTEVCGYSIEANDGEIGHVKDFIIDPDLWIIRYVEVSTRNWWPGKKVLISPNWVNRVSWEESTMSVALSRDEIKGGPAYIESVPVTRAYETALWSHYKRLAYWQTESDGMDRVIETSG